MSSEESLKKILSEFDAALPLAEAATAPASWYQQTAFFNAENSLLKNSWQFVAPLDFFKENGSYHSGEFLGEPYVILRDQAGTLRAFYNVCRHHAACLVSGQGKVEHLTCPYHGWSYGLDGALQKAPGLGAVKNFRKTEMGLVSIPLKVVGPFVLLHFSGSPEGGFNDLLQWSDVFSTLGKTGYEKLRFVRRKEYEIRCNWKVYVDNYLDGGYHVEVLHRELAGKLELEGYRIENADGYTLQHCGGTGDKRVGDEAFYYWLYPNFMINRYGPIMDTNWVIPLSPDRCLTVFDYYFAEDSDSKFIEESLRQSDRVQQEDIWISESVQKGLGSRAYHAGRYSVQHESGMHLFHSWLHRDLSRISSTPGRAQRSSKTGP